MSSRVSILPVQKEKRKLVEKYRPNLPVLCNSLVTPVMRWRPLYCNMRSTSISFSQAFRTRWLYYVTVLRIVWQTCIFCQLFSFWFCSTYSFGQTASSELEARTSDCPCHLCCHANRFKAFLLMIRSTINTLPMLISKWNQPFFLAVQLANDGFAAGIWMSSKVISVPQK